MSGLDEIVSKINRLVSMPDIYLRLQELVKDPKATLFDFAQLIEKDPGLAAKVLSIANSSFYGFPAQISTLSRAVNILGIAQLHDLVLAGCITKAFKGVSLQSLDIDAFWQRAVFCGVCAKLLAERCRILDSERLFILGLLHEIGHLALYSVYPEEMQAIQESAKSGEETIDAIERRELGYDYAQVGAALMRAWKLPTGMQEAAACHRQPSLAKDFPFESILVHLAWRLALAEQSTENQKLLPLVSADIWSITGLNEGDLEPVAEAARGVWQEIHSLFTR